MPISKKEFKENCREEVYTGYNGHRTRINCFHYDWKSGKTPEGKYFGGYKYRMYANVKNMSKAELFKAFYNWVVNEIQPDYYVQYKFAATDEQRFKVSLSL